MMLAHNTNVPCDILLTFIPKWFFHKNMKQARKFGNRGNFLADSYFLELRSIIIIFKTLICLNEILSKCEHVLYLTHG